MRFFADDHVRRLARWLRAAGFDVAWEASIDDAEIVSRCRREGRVLLTLDRALARRRGVSICLLNSHDPLEQLRQVVRVFELDLLARAFTRCPVCNETFVEADPDEVDVPSRVRATIDRYSRCPRCDRVYWEGDHTRHMRERFASVARG